MIIHLIDGTYELFRHFYGIRRFKKTDPPFGAVAGVLHMVAKMIEDGATHLGVATDHVIESFRNQLWAEYKTGAGIEPALWAQFHPLEEALAAMGVVVWPMIEVEADDALASAAHLAAQDERVEKVCIWTPDKDLAQCVVGDRVVQVDRRSGEIRDEPAIRAKYGVAPAFIADYLALVGDAADGYPGISGLGKKTAATLINRHGHIEQFPVETLTKENLARALLFKDLATLRTDVGRASPKGASPKSKVQSPKGASPKSKVQSPKSVGAKVKDHPQITQITQISEDRRKKGPLFDDVDELRWHGATPAFAAWAKKIEEKTDNPRLATRVRKLQSS